MRLGIMGGAFDPVHNGHIALTTTAESALGLDAVLWIPAGNQNYRAHMTDAALRLEMTRRAVSGHAGWTVSDCEIARGGISYTADTVRALRALHPADELFLLMGADKLAHLPDWQDFDALATNVTFVAAPRGMVDIAKDAERVARAGGKILRLPVLSSPASASMVREFVQTGQSLQTIVPPAVADFIAREGLYRIMPEAAMIEKLRATLKKKRFQHTLGVADTAARLAPRYGVNVTRARIAGLLHDSAKWMSEAEMLEWIQRGGIVVDDEERKIPAVLHAPAGAAYARLEYGVYDPEILSAIRRHTVGGCGMTALETLIYVADYIEPNRAEFPGLDAVRALAETDLFAAAREEARRTAQYICAAGQIPDRRTLAMLNTKEEPTC